MKSKKESQPKSEVYARFMHVVSHTEGRPFYVQAISEDGRLLTVKCAENIYRRVLGTRSGERGTQFHLGLRQLTQVKFYAHFDLKGYLCSLDIIPARMFVSGAAPRAAGDAAKKGFDLHFDETINGYDIWMEDPRSGEKVRAAYAGLAERDLLNLLNRLREADWEDKKVINLEDHRFEKIEENLIRCRPLKEVKYTT